MKARADRGRAGRCVPPGPACPGDPILSPASGFSPGGRRSGRVLAVLLLPALLAGTAAQATCTPSAGFPPPVAPDERFMVTEPDPGNHPGDRVVRDSATGLIWKQCWEGLSGPACAVGESWSDTWAAALARANAATHAGFSDWRLPTPAELMSLFETSCVPTINEEIFPNFSSGLVWTSVTAAGEPPNNGPDNAWVVNFFEGSLFLTLKEDSGEPLLVRSGNGFASFASDADHTPDVFAFPAQSGVALSTPVASATIVVSGLTTVTGIKIAGAAGSSYAINGGPFTADPGSLANGDSVTVMHTSANTTDATVSSLVTIGGVTAEFASTTEDPDAVFADGFE